jgi:hypothetical protein
MKERKKEKEEGRKERKPFWREIYLSNVIQMGTDVGHTYPLSTQVTSQ